MSLKHGADTSQQQKNEAPSKVKLMIHHQFPGMELVSPLYVTFGARRYLPPAQKVVFDSKTEVDFKTIPSCRISSAVLIYEVQRHNADQSIVNAVSREKTMCTWLAIIWKINHRKEFLTASYLIEYDENRGWNRDKLMKLVKYYELTNIQNGSVEETWLMHDNTVLLTKLNVTHKVSYNLGVTISETGMGDDTRRPLYFDPSR
jgi:hypothetical protein